MRAFITGITGFAGSHLAEHLLASGDDVCGSARSGQWGGDAPESLRNSAQVKVVVWDLAAGLSPAVVDFVRAFAPDCIYHLAALSVPRECGRDEPTPEAIAVNVGGTRAVIELAATLPRSPRVLIAGSGHVYAPVTSERPFVAEDSPLGPSTGYGKTKLAAEELTLRAVAGMGCDAILARVFKHTGPRQSSRLMVPEWAEQFARGGNEPVRVLCLNSVLDICDVRDTVRAYRLLMKHGERGGIYNVGGGIPRRSGDLFLALRQLAAPHRPFVETSPGRRQEPIADISRLTKLTGWRPEIPLQTTLADTWEYWRGKAALE